MSAIRFRLLPTAYEQAERDRKSRQRNKNFTVAFFRYILLPLARPSLLAVATLGVIASWNEYFLLLIVLTDSSLWRLPLGIIQFQGQYGTDYARIMAYVTLLIVPAVLFYLVAEKLDRHWLDGR